MTEFLRESHGRLIVLGCFEENWTSSRDEGTGI